MGAWARCSAAEVGCAVMPKPESSRSAALSVSSIASMYTCVTPHDATYPRPIIHTMSTTSTLYVDMSCGGCSGAVQRILGKLPAVSSVEPSLESQTVTVQHDASTSSADLVAALQTWSQAAGKRVSTEPLPAA